MQPIFTQLIQNLFFKQIKDKVAIFIANERDNQIKLAREQEWTEQRIKEEIDFTIFTDKFKPLNKEDLPCVIIDIINTNYSPTMQYTDKMYATSTLQLYLFSNGYSQQDTTNTINKIITDDKMSSLRLDYLLSQILAICNSERAYCFGTENNRNKEKQLYIDKKVLLNWKRILTPDDTNQVETKLAYLLEYNVSYFEITK